MILSILGSYAEWNHEDPDNDNYCSFTPFMFSFVWLVVKWTLFPLCYLAEMAGCYIFCSVLTQGPPKPNPNEFKVYP